MQWYKSPGFVLFSFSMVSTVSIYPYESSSDISPRFCIFATMSIYSYEPTSDGYTGPRLVWFLIHLQSYKLQELKSWVELLLESITKSVHHQCKYTEAIQILYRSAYLLLLVRLVIIHLTPPIWYSEITICSSRNTHTPPQKPSMHHISQTKHDWMLYFGFGSPRGLQHPDSNEIKSYLVLMQCCAFVTDHQHNKPLLFYDF